MLKTVLIPFCEQTSKVSLRSLDWLVTNYSKSQNTAFEIKNEIFNMYQEYKTELSYHRRTNFDPFRRRLRISFSLSGKTYQTTIGQANFMMWAHENNVLEYAAQHAADIETHMNTANAPTCATRKKRRKELSLPPKSKVTVYRVHTPLHKNMSPLEKC